MDLNLLYKNAIYYKKNILPKTFILKTKNLDIVIKPTEKDFAHLIGKQYSLNDKIFNLKSGVFFNKALKKDINILDMMQNSDILHLTQKQKYIYNKNIAFIPLFEDFINKVNLRKYRKDYYLNNIDNFQCDYHHNRIVHLNEIGQIDELEVLAIKHDNVANFLFNSILKTNNPTEIQKFTRTKLINVFDVKILDNKDYDQYLRDYKNYKQNNISIKKSQNKRRNILNNKQISDINLLLKNKLTIKKGMYGKNTIQVYKKGVLIEKKAIINFSNTAQQIAQYINDKYK